MISSKNNETNLSCENEESLERDTETTAEEIYQSPKDQRKTIEVSGQLFFKVRKESDKCYVNNLLDKCGTLYVSSHNFKKYHLARIRRVTFPLKREIFEKGKCDPNYLFRKNIKNIPEAKFWAQRYYYYSRYDEGIQMDYESN